MEEFLTNVATWQAIGAGMFVGVVIHVMGLVSDRIRLKRWEQAGKDLPDPCLTPEEIQAFADMEAKLPHPRPAGDDAA